MPSRDVDGNREELPPQPTDSESVGEPALWLEINTEREYRHSPELHSRPGGCSRASCPMRSALPQRRYCHCGRGLVRVQLVDCLSPICLNQGTCHPSWHRTKLGISGRNLPHGSEHFLLSITPDQRSKDVVNGFKTCWGARGTCCAALSSSILNCAMMSMFSPFRSGLGVHQRTI